MNAEFFPQASNNNAYSGYGGRDGNSAWIQQHGLHLTEGDKAMAHASCLIYQ